MSLVASCCFGSGRGRRNGVIQSDVLVPLTCVFLLVVVRDRVRSMLLGWLVDFFQSQ